MVDGGLDISEEQFMKLSVKERDVIMFRNLIYIRKKFKDYSLTKRIQYVWLVVVTLALGLRKFIPL